MQEKRYPLSQLTLSAQTWGRPGGKTVMLLHGFPESPKIFESVAQELCQAGFFVVAPFLPGYGGTPSVENSGSAIYLNELSETVNELAEQLKVDAEELVIVGHDWGAIAAYVAAIARPDLYRHLITLSVPPLATCLRNLWRYPGQCLRSSYILFFQLPFGIPEKVMKQDDFQRLHALCSKWTGGVEASGIYFSDRRKAFEAVNDLTPPLAYYRGLLPFRSWNRWQRALSLARRKISVPASILCGELDGCFRPEFFANFSDAFTGPVSLNVVPGAGHFLPLDAPETVSAHIREAFNAPRTG